MTTTAATQSADTINAVVDRYFGVWNETDASLIHRSIQSTWTPDARYVDPMFSAEGAEAIGGLVGGLHQQYPGHRFRQIGSIDAHHDRARWAWEFIGPEGGPPLATGVDFATLAPDGRLREVIGFFEHPQPAA